VYYTNTRKICTLHIGLFKAHLSVSHCPDCNEVYHPEAVTRLVPEYCNIGYDVLVYIGQLLFVDHHTISETLTRLEKCNIHISASEISVLAKRYIVCLAIAHKQSREKIKQHIYKNGGYILHIDGTSEGGSPHLISALDEISQFVLDNVKTQTENTEQIIPLLEEVKANYGNPLATVTDMGRAMLGAIQKVFPEVLHFICHFHFLRDIGKDLMEKQYSVIRNTLKKYGVSKQLRYRLRQCFMTDDDKTIDIELISNVIGNNCLPVDMSMASIRTLCYTLIIWTLDGKNQGDGFGFPFDRPHFEFYQRLGQLYEILRKTIRLYPVENTDVGKFIGKLTGDLKRLIEEPDCKNAAETLKKEIQVFDDLRKAMHIARPSSGSGLNDTGEDIEINTISKSVKNFKDRLIAQNFYKKDQGYRKMTEQIEKYWEKLFADPIEVKVANDTIKIHPQRTNNILEQFFRDFKRNHRRTTGNNSMSKKLQTMLAETPLVKNLENPEYMNILLDGSSSLEERFAEIDNQLVREASRKARLNEERIPPKLKKIIRSKKQMGILINLLD